MLFPFIKTVIGQYRRPSEQYFPMAKHTTTPPNAGPQKNLLNRSSGTILADRGNTFPSWHSPIHHPWHSTRHDCCIKQSIILADTGGLEASNLSTTRTIYQIIMLVMFKFSSTSKWSSLPSTCFKKNPFLSSCWVSSTASSFKGGVQKIRGNRILRIELPISNESQVLLSISMQCNTRLPYLLAPGGWARWISRLPMPISWYHTIRRAEIPPSEVDVCHSYTIIGFTH